MRRLLPVLIALAVLGPTPLYAASKAKSARAAKAKPKPAAAQKPKGHLEPIKLHEPAQDPEEQKASQDAPPPRHGPTRIDFDDRLVQGQTNKSGSVYLYDRKELQVRSMVHKPDNFRDEIVGFLDDR